MNNKHKYNYVLRCTNKTDREITIFKGILQNHPLTPKGKPEDIFFTEMDSL